MNLNNKYYLSLHCIHHMEYTTIYYTINVPSVINAESELVMLHNNKIINIMLAIYIVIYVVVLMII